MSNGPISADPGIAELSNLLGKVFHLPAPVLPMSRFSSEALATPMSTAEHVAGRLDRIRTGRRGSDPASLWLSAARS